MKARRTVNCDVLHTLPGGNEDNYLWSYYAVDDDDKVILCTVWVPTDKERERIANGENIRLLMWSQATPPLAMDLTDEPLGKPKETDDSTEDMEGDST